MPVCPRHSDRVSYVKCQRCGRPACPECQRSAAVGIQCVDCVREQAKAAPRATTQFGAAVTAGRPVVTMSIIALCVASWILQLATHETWTRALWFAPVLGHDEPYRFLTAAFLHSTNVTHILFNMVALWFTGPYLEQALGRWRFTALYVLSAIGGSAVYLVLAGGPTGDLWLQPVVGASGAIFGLFGALFLVQRRLGLNANGVLVLIAINLAIGAFGSGIAWQAHIGGLVVGLIVAAGYAFAPRGKQFAVSIATTVAVPVLLAGVVFAVYAAAGY